jgi:acyl transferase domain-containing protein
VRQLAQYLASEHAAALAPHFRVDAASAASPPPVAQAAAAAADDETASFRGTRSPLVRAPRLRRDARISVGNAAAMQPPASRDIAIIGISGRYPGADTLAQLWERLRSGDDCIGPVPDDRWPLEGFYNRDRGEARRCQQSYLNVGGFLNDVTDLDESFFAESAPGIPAAASEMLLLESAWHLLESGGYTRSRLQAVAGSQVGVFVGAMPSPAGEAKLEEQPQWDMPQLSMAGLPHRISRFLRLTGPSLAIDTQSSSSMTAVHYACESLHRGECRMAIAGGVTVLSPDLFRGMSQLDAMGTRPTSRSFTDGDGLIPAEGAGLVLLKPLKQAMQDGDDILAVIKSTSINYAGADGPPGIPSVNAQADLFTATLQRAGVDPRTISYVEAAAYGSPLGDAIEVSALTRAFRKYTDDVGFCAIGSIKSNIGHAVAASGISQLTKVVLQLRHGELPPVVISSPINPNIHFGKTPFRLQTRLEPWQRPTLSRDGRPQEVPRRAMVNSFGAGGAYACAVIEEFVAPPVPAAKDDTVRAPNVFVLSAQHKEGLRRQALQMLQFLRSNTEPAMHDLACHLQNSREAMAARLAIVASTREEVVLALARFVEGGAGEDPSVPVFVGDQSEHPIKIRSLIDKDAEEALLRRYAEQRDLSKLALYWVAGSNVPWLLLYREPLRRVADLPLYPFARRKPLAGGLSTAQDPSVRLVEATDEPMPAL